MTYYTTRCDVRRGSLSKLLEVANHTHTWWYNMAPLSSPLTQRLIDGSQSTIHCFSHTHTHRYKHTHTDALVEVSVCVQVCVFSVHEVKIN